jgi:hypothetical protein
MHTVLHEVQVRPYPQKHAIEVRFGRRFFAGNRPAVGDKLRANGIAIIMHDLASRGPQSVDPHQCVAFIHRAIGAFDASAIAEIFDLNRLSIILEGDESVSAAGLKLDRQQIATMHDDVGITEVI